MPSSTMCVCGDMRQMADLGADNVFVPHVDRHTGKPCPGLPLRPPFDPIPDDAPRSTKLFCSIDHASGEVIVAIAPQAQYDYAIAHRSEGVQVHRDSYIRIAVADFDDWISHMQEWWNAEKGEDAVKQNEAYDAAVKAAEDSQRLLDSLPNTALTPSSSTTQLAAVAQAYAMLASGWAAVAIISDYHLTDLDD